MSKTQKCLERWALALIENEYYHIPWDVITSDLRETVQNHQALKQRICCSSSDDIEFETIEQSETYDKMYWKLMKRNEKIFDDSTLQHIDVVRFIIQSYSSPLSLALYPKHSVIKCKDYHKNIQRMLDSMRIIKLLIQYDVIIGYDVADDIRRALDILNTQQTRYRKTIIKEFVDVILALNGKQQWILINITLNTDEKTITREGLLSYNYFSKYSYGSWSLGLATKTYIVQRLLFRGIQPFAFVIENDNIHSTQHHWGVWLERLSTLKSTEMNDNLEALVSPFMIYPFFKKAKTQMLDILTEYVPLHNDCIAVILDCLYMDDVLYTSCYSKYRNDLQCKYVELLLYLKRVENVTKDKYFHTQIFESQFDDPLFLQSFFTLFERDILEHMDLRFCRKILIKYKSYCRLSIKGYHHILSKVIEQTLTERDKKYKFSQFMEILSSPLLNDKEVANILNYSDDSHHTLLVQIINANRKECLVRNSMNIWNTLMNHKHIDINIANRCRNEFNENYSNAFDCAVCRCRTVLVSILLRSNKVVLSDVCQSMNACMQRDNWGANATNRSRIVALKIGTYLVQIQCGRKPMRNKKKIKMVKKTRKEIRTYLKTHKKYRSVSNGNRSVYKTWK
eukprot:67656_1